MCDLSMGIPAETITTGLIENATPSRHFLHVVLLSGARTYPNPIADITKGVLEVYRKNRGML